MDLSPALIVALHLCGAVGFVVVVSLGTITSKIRSATWPDMMGCPMCFGVWGGAGWAALVICRLSGLLPGHIIWRAHDALAFAFAVSVLSYGVGVAHTFLRLAKEKAAGGSAVH